MGFFKIFQTTTRRLDIDRTTLLTLHKIVLGLLLLMMLVSPFLQIDSLDQFPVATDDIEVVVIYCLATVGMLLLCAHLVKLVPALLRACLPVPPAVSKPSMVFIAAEAELVDVSPPFAVPLRI
jgi:hypothetical protein